MYGSCNLPVCHTVRNMIAVFGYSLCSRIRQSFVTSVPANSYFLPTASYRRRWSPPTEGDYLLLQKVMISSYRKWWSLCCIEEWLRELIVSEYPTQYFLVPSQVSTYYIIVKQCVSNIFCSHCGDNHRCTACTSNTAYKSHLASYSFRSSTKKKAVLFSDNSGIMRISYHTLLLAPPSTLCYGWKSPLLSVTLRH